MSFDLDHLRALIDLLTEKEVAEFEHEENGRRIRISRGARPSFASTTAPTFLSSPVAHSVAPPVVTGGSRLRGSASECGTSST